ncbi:thyroid transcription factor 1-associated protein 26 homolog [Diorhabda carinulata]|uniref:thyroid transcription factor 1-associated protein 26 homolog n=1 Tax=Diorhabda carinulata TaxID=1163345 RepID=UPI0025A21FCB|nr:thyroid transcription factor 1-associated protein 26 homolog [Diorhabda carinulata]
MAKYRVDEEKSKTKGKSVAKNAISTNSGFFVKTSKQRLYNKRATCDSSKEVETGHEKKPFDKKLYRLKKYSKKYKLQQWEDIRKKTVLKDFYKQVKDTDSEFDVAKIYNDPKYRDSDEDQDDNKLEDNATAKTASSESDVGGNNKLKPFRRALDTFKRIKSDKAKEKEEFLKRKAEKEEALKQYRREKALKYRQLSKKTKKGQPVMKYRMEMLLEKIQKMS